MDLFHSSGHFSETSVPASSSDREAADEADCHQNLIRFLQVAQVLGVPLLPLAWDPALESVGREGSTAHINQSTLNAEFTFAFKRFKPHTTRNDVSEGEFRQMQYDAAIAEMTVLSHRTIRRHPNIVTFVGAGFEMSPVSDEVWPVLVSTKADLGDLYTFLSTRTPLHVESLVAICKEIASGIQVMHHCGVIHGDLKPTNILVEDVKDTDNIQVKVTDFGFSCFQAAQNSDLKVARTQPWEAPEWHSRHFSIADAKAMDIYSFGLLCLWILFRHEKLVVLGVPLVTLDEAFLSKDAAVTAKVQSLKKRADNSMLSCALGLVSNAIGIDDEYGSRLRRLFNLTLCSDPEQRAQTLDDLIPILAVSGQEDEAGMSSTNVSEPLRRVAPPQWHGTFLTSNTFFYLEMLDFRISEHIAHALRTMAEGEGCSVCQNNAALQLAVCHSMGFGVALDNKERDFWLQKSGRELHSLQNTLDQIRVDTGTKVAGFVVDLFKRGYRESLLDRYRRQGMLAQATSKHRAMVHNRERVFGPTHYTTIRAKMLLVGLLCYTHSFQEALATTVENINNAGSDIGLRDRLSLKSQLSFIYRRMSRFEEAEAILRDVIRQWGEHKDSPSYWYDQAMLANLLLEKGDSSQALELSLTTEKDAVLSLGPYHPTRISASRVVVDALDAEGRLETAVWMHERLLGTIEKCYKADDGVLIAQLAIIALQYYRLDRLSDAKRCYARIQSLIADNIENALPAIRAVGRYAAILNDHNMSEEARTIMEHLCKEAEKLLGAENEDVAGVRDNLATTYRKQQRWTEAECLQRQVLDFRRKTLGDKHYLTLATLDGLALTLMCRWQWAEAASLWKQSLEIRDGFADTRSKTRITLLSEIGRCLTLSRAHEEAVGFWNRLLDLIRREDGESGTEVASSHLKDMVLTTVCYAELGQRSAMRQYLLLALTTLQRPWQDAPVAVVHHFTVLATVCGRNAWLVEAEQALAAARLVIERAGEYMIDSVVQRLEAAVVKFLVDTGKSELEFDPSTLDDGDSGEGGHDLEQSIAHQPASP